MPRIARISNLGQDIKVQPGDVYEFVYDVATRAGHTHPKGSLLVVIQHTTKTPHGEIGENGNWVCKTQFGTSVWSTLENGIARGLYTKVEIRHSSTQEEQDSNLWTHLQD